MIAYTIYLPQIKGLLRKWSQEFEIHVPTRAEGDFFEFRPWTQEVEIAWDYDLAYTTLKKFFLPPKEDILCFNMKDYSANPVINAPRQLLLGVHPYDIKAVNQLDQLMDMDSPDVNYRARRDNTLIFGLEPANVADTAFWSSMGAARVDFGFDLYWTRISPGAFFVQVGSAKGEEMIKLDGPIEKSSVAQKEAARRAHLKILAQAEKRTLKYDWNRVPDQVNKFFSNRTFWMERAKTCLSCGSCNLVCPTCYCFDIQEEADDLLKQGKRYRQWDGCMLTGFAEIAGGHNFRASAWERYRHRYMRKGKYIFDKLGELGCVGCGRCVRACTARIANPREVYNDIWEAIKNEI
ncbi:4Fe-4S dicluster domain-containing protein [Desulfonatronovibrio hydrogenovorans]|uniref:4Fe-4S dicluster domain-containing protein n=1 Tax=Desulfonatronovibrio hydrogenovorans TaxID=53245 RepID=UPI00048E8CA6|nr:4Fe-4S dicluster domain-containing protein [Desulfonatronovibrio hydrogenovorans]